jgi:hypothetical protein
MAVQDLQQLHDQIAKDKQRATGKKLRETSIEIFILKKQLRKPGSPEAKQDIADRVTHLQHELSSALEARDTASTKRIRNFYKTTTGKMVPETFHCIKEGNRSRAIHKLEHEGRTVMDPEEIITIMQQWYEKTAERLIPQAETLYEFLERRSEGHAGGRIYSARSQTSHKRGERGQFPWPLRSNHCVFQVTLLSYPHGDDCGTQPASLCSSPAGSR